MIQTSDEEEIMQIEEDSKKLEDSEVKWRLKKRGEPITLFGEREKERLDRLLKLEGRKPFDYENDTETKGSQFLEAMKRESEIYEEDPLVKMRRIMEAEDPDFKIENRKPMNEYEEVLFFWSS